MARPEKSTPEIRDADRDALVRLETDLQALEAQQRRPTSIPGVGSATGAGYNLLGQMLGGIFGGVGLGWLVDHFVHTQPWGLIVGLFGGAALSIWSTVRIAGRTGSPGVVETKRGPPGPRGDVTQARDENRQAQSSGDTKVTRTEED